MVLGIDLGFDTAGLLQSVTSMGKTFLILFTFLILMIPIFITILNMITYNIRFRIRQITGSKKIIIDDWAKEVKGANGVEHWRIKGKKINVPVPPPNAIEINNKGKMVVEAYLTAEGELKYIEDKTQEVDSFQPLLSKDREFYINQMRKAEERRKKGIIEYVPVIASGLVLVLVMGLMFAFWEDITDPMVKVSQQNAVISQENGKTIQILQEMIQKKQIIVQAPQHTEPPPN